MSARRMRPTKEAHPEIPAKASTASVPTQQASRLILPAVDEAHVLLVSTPAGRHSRRVFLSLHSAQKAMDRAHARGQLATITLCRLVPVGGA